MKKLDYACIVYVILLLIFGFDDNHSFDKRRNALKKGISTSPVVLRAHETEPLKISAAKNDRSRKDLLEHQ